MCVTKERFILNGALAFSVLYAIASAFKQII